MNLLEAAGLGLLQGATEFLPVSSSGHLAIGQYLLGIKEPPIFFDVILHIGTLLAVSIFFRRDLLELTRTFIHRLRNPFGERNENDLFLAAIIAGSIPTAFIGFAFKDLLESAFASLDAVGIGLMVTGALLLLTRRIQSPNKEKPLNFWRAILIGTAQGIAITPGISRSGATISVGIMAGLDRAKAARYSFLLSIPAILGALALQLKDGVSNQVALLPMTAGFLSAFVVGYFSLGWLMKAVRPGAFHKFSYYCLPLGAIAFLIGISERYF